MKKKMLYALGLLLAGLLVFSGCEQPGNGDEYPAFVFDGTRVKNDGGVTTYYNLYVDLDDPENPLSQGDNKDWEIMISAAKEILTNSGVTATAESSLGQGGVVFSGNTDFDTAISVAQAQALFVVAPGGGEDYEYWDKYHDTSTAKTKTGNAVSFPGYSTAGGRDGTTQATAWVWDLDLDFSLGTAYCEWDRMAPNFRDYTYNVYVIKSGDGLSYYKIQIIEASYLKETHVPNAGWTTYHYTYKVYIEELS